jgi:hypothetical protein
MKKQFYLFSANWYNRSYICISTLALLLGGIIYILFRVSEPLFFQWIRAAGSDKWFDIARQNLLPLGQHLPEWIVFSLPNGLWAFAYALLITGIWSGSKSWLRYCWIASIPLLVLGYEVLQFPGIIPGTFSIQDIALGITGLTSGIFVGIKTTKSNHHEKISE